LIIKDTFSALAVYSLTEKMGIRIPEDFLLIAIGSDFQMENIASNLSLLKMPGFTMGNEAAEILFDQIQNPLEEKKSAIIPVNFILKSSSIRI
jgi:DNA-binding LacI/PurR family transcriptional regulator